MTNLQQLLGNAIELSSKVTVYVPSTVNVNIEIDNKKYVDMVASKLSQWFGGSTSCQAQGYYVADDKSLVTEKTTMVYGYCTTSQLEEHASDILQLVNDLKNEMVQECIGFEINNKFYMI